MKTRKKSLPREILGFIVMFNRVFRLRTKVYSRLWGGAQTIFWGAQASKSTGSVTLFWGTILAWGAQAVIGEHGPEMLFEAPSLKHNRGS